MCHSKLSQNLNAWRIIQAPDYVINWIEHGVSIPLSKDIAPFDLKNHSFSTKEECFVDCEIERLQSLNYIESCDYKPTCVSPLPCVPKKNGKFRLITDLRQLNSHCSVPKFRNDDIRQDVILLKPNDKLISAAIKDGFFHVKGKGSV